MRSTGLEGDTFMKLRWIKISGLLGIMFTILSFQNCAVVNEGDGRADLATLDSSDPTYLRNKAMGILATKCASCHNQDISEGGIGYMTDLSLLLFYKMVKPYDPEHSDIYMAIRDGSMPPGKPLSTAEVKIIYDWINVGFKDTTPPPPPNLACPTLVPKFSCIKQYIIQAKCATCHTTQSLGGLNLSTYQGTLNVVTGGQPMMSPFYTRTLDNSMPPNGNDLTDFEKGVVRMWIENGAQND